MIELTLGTGEVIKLPVTVDDAPAKAWFQMAAFERELELRGADVEPVDFIAQITSAVRSVVDFPETMTFGLPSKSLEKKEWMLEPAFIVPLDRKQIKPTILGFYRHLLWVVRSFEPVEFPIEYKGVEWNVTPNAEKLAYPGEFTAQETVEVLKLEQMFEKELETARKGEIFDFGAIASSDFGLEMYQIALLLRPVNDEGLIEPLPMGEVAVETYINNRVKELEELPMSVILSVRFFFQNTLTKVSAFNVLTANLSERLSTPLSGLE